MRIEEIKTYIVNAERQNWLFVKVITDTGLYGWGEASVEGQELAVEACIKLLTNPSRGIIGANPLDIELIWRRMYHEGFWKGGFVYMSAISGIDQALWDIAGKFYGVPTYQLLGGKLRSKIRCYTHAPNTNTELAKHLVFDMGFAGVKTNVDDPSPEAFDEGLSRMRAAIGQDKLLMVDNHGQLSPAQAARRLAVAEKHGLFFYEEPIPPENPEEFRRLRQTGSTQPLASGERIYSRFEARTLIEEQLIDFFQPDICHCGGISEIRRLASYAETYHIKFAPHSPNGPVATAASIAVAASTQNFAILEFASTVYHRSDLFDIDLTARDGYFSIPERPGLGIELDESKFAQYPPMVYQHQPRLDEDGTLLEI